MTRGAPTTQSAAHDGGLRPRRMMRQGGMLLAGATLTQLLGFGRNALLAYGLSRGDFGIAAAILATLQLIETGSEISADRYIMQADERELDRALEACHALLVLRGVVCALLIAALAAPAATLFGAPGATAAFLVAAMVPLIKGFTNLDSKRAQRAFDNRPAILIELVPQALALAAAWPLVVVSGSYEVAVALALLQALAGVVASHILARHRWRATAGREALATLTRFAAPLWIAGLPLALVLHGERAIVGAAQGAEAIAGFTAAAMVAAALGAIAARIGQALILPALVEAREVPVEAARRLAIASDLSAIAAGAIAAAAVVGGTAMMTLLFGWRYADTGAVLACLVAGAAIKIFQAPVSLASMANGRTRVFVTASLARALALLPLAALAAGGASLAWVAAASATAELLSLAMFVHGAPDRQVAVRTAVRGLAAMIACTACAVAVVLSGSSGLGAAVLAAAAALLAAAAVLPETRRLAIDGIVGLRSKTALTQ